MNHRVKSILLFLLLPTGSAAYAAEDIHDVKPPVALPFDYLFLIWILAAILAALSAWFWWTFYRRGKPRKEKKVFAPPVIPWVEALRLLEELRAENLPAAGKIKEYYSRLSDIARHYIEGRFAIRAPEMTTEEFLSSLRDAAVLASAQKEVLRDFLICCDMVKFARFTSSEKQMEESFAAVKRLVEETIPSAESATPVVPSGVTVASQ